MLSKKQLIALVLSSFEAEKANDIKKNSSLLHRNFRMTDMVYVAKDEYFPRLEGESLEKTINSAFLIKNREFKFKSVVADKKTQTVIVEFIESYPDTSTGRTYRTPQIAVCEIKDGTIYRTRHYMDPRLSFEYLSPESIDKAML
jgi:ketosteroid isomerase-like protein